jgi:hypothetical protein
MITTEFVIYDRVNQDDHIATALAFVNQNLQTELVADITVLGATPPLTNYGSCYFLAPQNIPESDIAQLPLACTYMILWRTSVDNVCWGGGNYGLAINGRPTCTIPCNVGYWETLQPAWGHHLVWAETVIIHELHHNFENFLFDLLGYPIAMRRSEHTYGATVPHMDRMSDFGFTDHDEWSAWAYQQISPEMCTAIEAFCGAVSPPPASGGLLVFEESR